MDELPSNLRKDLLKIIPLSVFNEVKSFDLYDNHPIDNRSIEVIVCTQRGEIIEYFKREIVQSYTLKNLQNIKEIKLIRNRSCDLFYLVHADDKIILLSRKKSILKHHEIDNVYSYSLDDTECKGRPRLKIIKTDTGVPLVFDDDFVNLEEQLLESRESPSQDGIPLLEQLKRKLTEAQYCVEFNQDKHKELMNLRQQAIFHMYESRENNLYASITVQDIAQLSQIETNHPEVKLCNKKILIFIHFINRNEVSLEDVGIILRNTLKKTIKYKTKLFKEVPKLPYWREKEKKTVEANEKACVVAVIDLEELQNCPSSKVDFEIVMSYIKEGKCYLLPYDKVHITATDIMGDNFDVLAKDYDDRTVLCVLASCEKETLHLQHLPNNSEDWVTPHKIFCVHLKMVQLFENVAIHKSSPYHTLHGVMTHCTKSSADNFVIDIYTRSPSQLLGLVHYIYDAVPHRIIVLTKEIQMTSFEDTQQSSLGEELPEDVNLDELRKSMLYETSVMKTYLDKCLVRMNESKNPLVQAKIGREIDIVALGKEKFLEFRKKILESTEKGIVRLNTTNELEDMEL